MPITFQTDAYNFSDLCLLVENVAIIIATHFITPQTG